MRTIEDEFIHQEIREQAAIAARRAQEPPERWPEAPGRTIVAGAGDSLCVAELARELFPARRIEALPALAASSAARALGPGDAWLGVSVSGRTPRVVEGARRARARGATVVALTDDVQSPLAAAADRVWCIEASPPHELATSGYGTEGARDYVGYHHDVAQTKTFLAGLLTLARAAAPERELAPVAARVAERVRDEVWRPLAARAPRWAEAKQAFLLATGSALPLARFGAYKLYEYDRAAWFADVEEYCHTQYFVTRRGDALVFVLHDEDAARRAEEIAPVLVELFEARAVVLRADDVDFACAAPFDEVLVPAGASELERSVSFAVTLEWLTYLWGRVGAPDIDTFHAGFDTERLVAASMRTIRRSRIVAPE